MVVDPSNPQAIPVHTPDLEGIPAQWGGGIPPRICPVCSEPHPLYTFFSVFPHLESACLCSYARGGIFSHPEGPEEGELLDLEGELFLNQACTWGIF